MTWNMRDSGYEKDEHSSVAEDPRRRVWPIFLLGLGATGLLLGLMLGKWFHPRPVYLLEAREAPGALVLWFDRKPPAPRLETLDGALLVRLEEVQGNPQAGTLALDEGEVRWRLRAVDQALLLSFVATRPLRAEWRGEAKGGQWRLELRLAAREIKEGSPGLPVTEVPETGTGE